MILHMCVRMCVCVCVCVHVCVHVASFPGPIPSFSMLYDYIITSYLKLGLSGAINKQSIWNGLSAAIHSHIMKYIQQ